MMMANAPVMSKLKPSSLCSTLNLQSLQKESGMLNGWKSWTMPIGMITGRKPNTMVSSLLRTSSWNFSGSGTTLIIRRCSMTTPNGELTRTTDQMTRAIDQMRRLKKNEHYLLSELH